MQPVQTARAAWRGVIEEYRELLPVTEQTPVITLLEGGTPLIECQRLSQSLPGRPRVLAKFEGLNPTGSFKDRGMTVAISKALEEGAQVAVCASTGNTAASAAAYAARGGLQCAVLVPAGYIAAGKLAQARAHGAQVIAVEGAFDAALSLVRELVENHPVALVNSLNPHRLEGQKTAAFEVCDALGDAPDFHVLPVGNAGNIAAYWMGYCEYHALGKAGRRPRMLGFQAAGAAPIVRGRPVPNPETIATAIRIGNPASWRKAEAARDESGGLIAAVTDDEIISAYHLLGRTEGLFVEPAAAAGIAGLKHVAESGYLGEEPATVVCTLTGHGLKDPGAAQLVGCDMVTVPANMDSVLKALGL